ncbi:unknown [Bacteroides sp. CAG:1076]|nr:unknown [Bacteroides sp. CAG:1076]
MRLFCNVAFGDPLGARTQDPNIKSVVLYLLS